MLTASCHCGAVQLSIKRSPTVLTECNCSICHRTGALWAYYSPDLVSISCAAGATKGYIWGDRCIEFHHCTTCACVTHYTSTEKSHHSKTAVNARMLPSEVIGPLQRRQFDGADTWTYLED